MVFFEEGAKWQLQLDISDKFALTLGNWVYVYGPVQRRCVPHYGHQYMENIYEHLGNLNPLELGLPYLFSDRPE